MEQIRLKQNSFLRFNARNIGYWFLFVFVTLPHMKPDYLARIPAADLIFDIFRVLSFLIIVFWFVLKRKSVTILFILVAAWRFFLLYSTIINEGEVYPIIVDSFSILSIVLLYDVALSNRKTVFISAQMFCYELIVYINLITEFLYPDGMYTVSTDFVFHTQHWFLGYYNTHTRYYFPALMFAWLYKEATGKKFRAYSLLIAIWVAAIRVWSGGTLLSLGIMVIVYALFKNRTHLFNYYNYWLLHIIFFVFIVILKLQNYFIWLLEGILGKWASLLVRMDLWDVVIKLVEDAPIFGHGYKDGVARTIETGIVFGSHAHNMLLEVLYQGGIINLVIWVSIIIIAGKKLYRYRDSTESKIIATAFLGWCVHTLVEPYSTPFLIGMFVIAYNSNQGEDLARHNSSVGQQGRISLGVYGERDEVT